MNAPVAGSRGDAFVKTITFLWIDPCPNARLARAQVLLKESVLALGLKPVCYACGPAMVKFTDVLRFARRSRA